MKRKIRFLWLLPVVGGVTLCCVLWWRFANRDPYSGRIERLIENNSLDRTTLVAVSIRDANSGHLLYDRRGGYLLHPASTLKVFSTALALARLGPDRLLSTGVYRIPKKTDLYLKLSADPLLTGEDLDGLFGACREKGVERIAGYLVIDDSIIDDVPWGYGWMWTDENHYSLPKISAYNIDHNSVKVEVTPGTLGSPPNVEVSPQCDVAIVNQATSSAVHRPAIGRRPWKNPDEILVLGSFSKPYTRTIPVADPRKYFLSNLRRALEKNDIACTGPTVTGVLPPDSERIAETGHTVFDIVRHTNRVSDCLAAETLLKIVGGENKKTTGSSIHGLKAFLEFYQSIGAGPVEQRVVDGSGTSTYNLVQPNWMTLALTRLLRQPFSDLYLKTLSRPGEEGRLQHRMGGLSERVWAKTGTLQGVSGLIGYVKADNGATYAFSILIQNYVGSVDEARKLEDRIVEVIARH